jgi:hypothetical protein
MGSSKEVKEGSEPQNQKPTSRNAREGLPFERGAGDALAEGAEATGSADGGAALGAEATGSADGGAAGAVRPGVEAGTSTGAGVGSAV